MAKIRTLFLAAAALLLALTLVAAAPVDVAPKQSRRDYNQVGTAYSYKPGPLGVVTQKVAKLVYTQVPGLSKAPAQPSSYTSSPPAYSNDWKSQMLQHLNSIRAEVGKGPVTLNQNLNALAQDHSQYQASVNTMTHSDPGGSLGSRCSQYGIDWSGVAENVAYNYPDVASVMQGWKTSPGHYANMIGNYNSVGFGVSSNYWTQDFANI
ncbi:hypothetical protein IWQ57_005240 [Coemansia nantahalensis]|uniref:Uncharacterized protein n=2 Tax=Coemansia TaxID=4863 RepID=A0ACC1LB50_9FUNG|nr:hypothetical protein IWQ57_005240 [Coemansia nantahalensis]KAJ2805108.1 hypothetical protein H4R21_001387 [Coemansia helicoidea]